MALVFISYARQDRERVLPLARALEERGWTVWWDRVIPPGRKFDEVIEEQLDAAGAVIVVWTEASVDSDWVRTEAAEGASRNALVPVLMDPVRIPLAFRRVQAADLTDWDPGADHEGFDHLASSLETLLGASPADTSPATPDSAAASDAGPLEGETSPTEAPSLSDDPVDVELDRARSLAAEGDWRGVVGVLGALDGQISQPGVSHQERTRLLEEARRRIEADDLCDEAESLHSDGHFEEALVRLERVDELDPGNDRAAGLRTDALRRIDQERREAIARDLADARHAMANRSWSLAVPHLERVLAEDPDHVDARADLERARSGVEAERQYGELQEMFRRQQFDEVVVGMAALHERHPDFGDPDELSRRAEAGRDGPVVEGTAHDVAAPWAGPTGGSTPDAPPVAGGEAPTSADRDIAPDVAEDGPDEPVASDATATDDAAVIEVGSGDHGTASSSAAEPRRLLPILLAGGAVAVIAVVAIVVSLAGGDDPEIRTATTEAPTTVDGADGGQESTDTTVSRADDGDDSDDREDDGSRVLAATALPQFDGADIVVSGHESDEPSAAGIQAALDVFNERYDANAVYEADVDWEANLDTQLAGGAPPDISFFPRPPKLREVAGEGSVLPLPAEVDATLDEYWADSFQLDGQDAAGVQYGVPVRTNLNSIVWYQPARFDADGYDVPTTLGELVALVDEMSVSGSSKPLCEGIESGGATGWPVAHWTAELVIRQHGPDVYDQWVDHAIPFDDARIVESMQTLTDLLADEHVFASGGSIASTNFADNAVPLIDGDCYMYRQANFYSGLFPDGTAFADGSDGAVDAFYLPGIGDDRPIVVWGSIAAAFVDRPEVWALMDFMATAEWAETRQLAQAEYLGGDLTGFLSAAQGQDVSRYEPLEQRFSEIIANAGTSRFSASELMPLDVLNTFWVEGTSLVSGDIDAQTAAERIEASWPG